MMQFDLRDAWDTRNAQRKVIPADVVYRLITAIQLEHGAPSPRLQAAEQEAIDELVTYCHVNEAACTWRLRPMTPDTRHHIRRDWLGDDSDQEYNSPLAKDSPGRVQAGVLTALFTIASMFQCVTLGASREESAEAAPLPTHRQYSTCVCHLPSQGGRIPPSDQADGPLRRATVAVGYRVKGQES